MRSARLQEFARGCQYPFFGSHGGRCRFRRGNTGLTSGITTLYASLHQCYSGVLICARWLS
jgi:hypothetical protein